jgi:precorrin-3B methylase
VAIEIVPGVPANAAAAKMGLLAADYAAISLSDPDPQKSESAWQVRRPIS